MNYVLLKCLARVKQTKLNNLKNSVMPVQIELNGMELSSKRTTMGQTVILTSCPSMRLNAIELSTCIVNLRLAEQ